ncbi:hypothetical protein MKK65_08255 [Methylobacterium sp. J-001]|uniref:DUF6894 family protein n=1 Tax=Methylobacterium sp. J-001 TaxID=2836609 RepID=UPI001FB97D71|nr:hypothetical protein [Methylobacterium sp. J-001]
MPRFFFDIRDDKGTQRDEEGVELADLSMVREKAQRLLPDIARSEIQGDGDQHVYMVLVTDEDGHAVYSATLTYAGLWLLR